MKRKRFADGKFSVGYSRFLGYDKGEEGNLAINEEQAKIVRLIFRLFLEGMTACKIAKELAARHILTVTGKERWNAKTIRGVLTSEKYTGCARIQKTFTPDFLTKKAVKNCGQVPSYFVEQSHPAIIDPAVFEMVQREMERRTREGGRYSGVSIFSGKSGAVRAAVLSVLKFGTPRINTDAPSTVATTSMTGRNARRAM